MRSRVQTSANSTDPLSERALRKAIELVESGVVPDPMVRWAIRRMCAQRLRDQETAGEETEAVARSLADSPIALHVDKANEQHYEVPPAFFTSVLGSHLKYSCSYWPHGVNDLDTAETKMLSLTGSRAQLEDGMNILELGCGWGSLTLWIARKYPNCRIIAVSNASSQRKYVEAECASHGFTNVKVVTADANVFDTDERFDRVVSVEMFEHMRNYGALLRRISGWLRPEGRLFVHIFSHRRFTYPFEAEGAGDWMGRYFFTGGLMPGQHLLQEFDADMTVERHWLLDGTHYQKTSNAWLANLDGHRDRVRDVLLPVYGASDVNRWIVRWRIFFLACAELFGYDQGREWGVSHYLLRPTPKPS